jgi:tetratricopeptide (TPR) repeat protein
MKYVDLIVRYLSGDMSPEESGAFERELERDEILKEEYEDAAAAYELISDQLRKRDEREFRARLLEAMEAVSPDPAGSTKPRSVRWYLLAPLAASLAILVGIYLMDRGENRLLERFFKPGEDPVLLALAQETRGETEPGISLYWKGNYESACREMKEVLSRDPDNQLAMLYLLLCAMETGHVDEVVDRVLDADIKPDHRLGQCITWYTVLAMLKMNQQDEASELLGALLLKEGPYRTHARKLKRML